MADVKKIELSADEFRSRGVLWAVNRVLFHPRGFALAIHQSKFALPGEETFRGFQIWGNGDEPWTYDAPVDENERMRAFEALLLEATVDQKLQT